MSLSKTESDKLRTDLETMCRAAGKIHLGFWRNLKGIEKKGTIDLVTVSDREAENEVIRLIRELYPDHGILAEESGASDSDSEYLWIIDPLDGTTNFAHGLPIFSVSIGLQKNGETIAGAVFAPVIGELYLATLGHGATRNGERIFCSKTTDLVDAMVVTGFPYNRTEIIEWILESLRFFITNSRGLVRFGSAAYDLACVAGGTLDIFYEANLKAWDMCAGALLVTEAGGRMINFSGGSFDLFDGEMIAAANDTLSGIAVNQMKQNPHPSKIDQA